MSASPYFTAYLDRLETYHKEIETALNGLPQEGVDWSPGSGMNAIGVLVAHVAGSLTYWVGDTVGRGATDRIREQEFHTQAVDAETLRQRLSTAVADVRNTLSTLTDADLAAQRPVLASGGHRTSVAWVLAHALTHTAMHAGHIQLTRQLWDQRLSD